MKKFSNLLYNLYFKFILVFIPRNDNYVVIDIDNTINFQAERLIKYTKNGKCNYKKANSFSELMRDRVNIDAYIKLKKVQNKFYPIFLSARSIKYFFPTLFWLKKNDFSNFILVLSGKLERKINFLNLALNKVKIEFIIDDMKEGYEFNNPKINNEYFEYLKKRNIKIFFSFNELEDYYV